MRAILLSFPGRAFSDVSVEADPPLYTQADNLILFESHPNAPGHAPYPEGAGPLGTILSCLKIPPGSSKGLVADKLFYFIFFYFIYFFYYHYLNIAHLLAKGMGSPLTQVDRYEDT